METPAARSASPVVEPRHGGQILVDVLPAHDVGMASGVPGESCPLVLEGFYQCRDRTRFIVYRQEGGAANMADAYGKLTGHPGIVFCTRGPGVTNASIDVHTESQDSTSLILFTGQVDRGFVDREALQEIDCRRMFGQMVERVTQVGSVERIPEYITRTFQTATVGCPGPVVLVLPEDMLTDVATVPDVPPEFATEARVMAQPGLRDLAQLEALLQDVERPMLLLGGSGWTPQAAAHVQAFVGYWGLPTDRVLHRQDLFDNRHPDYTGGVGIAISPKLATCVKDADIVFIIDTHLGGITISGYMFFDAPRPRQTLTYVHAGVEELGRIYQADLMIHASVPVIARALDGVSPDAPPCWSVQTEVVSADCRVNIVPPSSGGKGIDMARVIQWLRERLSQNSTLTNGAGNYATWLHRFYQRGPLAAGSRIQLALINGTMGYSAPTAVAAKIVYPGAPVICMADDGCSLINSQGPATATRYSAPVIFIVVSNDMHDTIRMHQEREYPEHVSGTELRSLDLVASVRVYGVEGHTVRPLEDFQSAVETASTVSVVTVIEVQIGPNAIDPRAMIDSLCAQSHS